MAQTDFDSADPLAVKHGGALTPSRLFAAIGDSHTYNASTGVALEEFYPARVAALLGSSWTSLNRGVSGNTTAQMYDRRAEMLTSGVPHVACVYGGANGTDTQANLEALIGYLQDNGCARIMIVGQHYLNFSSNADTITTPRASLAAVRSAQAAAAKATSVPFMDTYRHMRLRIVDGADEQGDYAWHVADANTHLNAYGENILAEAIVATIEDMGWL